MSSNSYEHLIRRITSWSKENEDIQAVIIVGSRTRSQESFDIYSDLDLIVFTSAVEKLTLHDGWISELGLVWIADLDNTGLGDPEWIVIFDNGQKADFVITRTHAHLELGQMISRSGYRQVLTRGWQVLFDRWGSATGSKEEPLLATPCLKAETSEFSIHINRILIEAHRAAKFINRRELWLGQQMLFQIRQQLLWLMEEHTRLSINGEVDTWYEGRFIEQWVARSVKEKLPDLFAKYDAMDMARALKAALSMSHFLASEIAQYHDIRYPTAGQKATFDWFDTAINLP